MASLRRRPGRPGGDGLQLLRLAAHAARHASDAAAAHTQAISTASTVDDGRTRDRRLRCSQPGARSSTSRTPRRSSGAWCPTTSRSSIYRALVESAAGFFGAQMTAMRSASENAGEIITDYTLQMNRARQAEITQEIMEVVAGAEGAESSTRVPMQHANRFQMHEHSERTTGEPEKCHQQTNATGARPQRHRQAQRRAHRGDPGRRDRGRLPEWLPEINHAITIGARAAVTRRRRHQRQAGGLLVCEVQQHLGDDRVRAVAMDTTDGLARGAEVDRHRRADHRAGRRGRRSGASSTCSANRSTSAPICPTDVERRGDPP